MARHGVRARAFATGEPRWMVRDDQPALPGIDLTPLAVAGGVLLLAGSGLESYGLGSDLLGDVS